MPNKAFDLCLWSLSASWEPGSLPLRRPSSFSRAPLLLVLAPMPRNLLQELSVRSRLCSDWRPRPPLLALFSVAPLSVQLIPSGFHDPGVFSCSPCASIPRFCCSWIRPCLLQAQSQHFSFLLEHSPSPVGLLQRKACYVPQYCTVHRKG